MAVDFAGLVSAFDELVVDELVVDELLSDELESDELEPEDESLLALDEVVELVEVDDDDPDRLSFL